MSNTIESNLNRLKSFFSIDSSNREFTDNVNPYARAMSVGNKDYTFADVQKDPGKVMLAIMQQATSQYSVEIANWTGGKEEAFNVAKPRRATLMEMYVRALEDGFIYRQIEQRTLRITKAKFRIVDFTSREINTEKTDLFKKPWFKKFIRIALSSKSHGPTLLYISDLLEKQIKDVDFVLREHVVPEHNLILKKPTDNEGVDFTKPPYNKFTLLIGDRRDIGYLNKLIPLYILKKHSWAAWDKFEEMFGLPIRWAKTDKSDAKSLNEIQNWLSKMGKAAYGIFDKNTDFEIKESTRADAYQVFEMKRKACNEEIAITVNGQTMTTLDGSSRSQAEVHQSTQDDITLDDLDFIENLVNYDLMELCNYHGYDFTDQDVFEWDLPEDLNAKLKIFQGVKSMGFELDQDQVSKVFGVNITGKTTVTEGDDPKEKEPKK